MKLRNKKTGEVAEVYLDNYTDESNIVSVCLKVKDDVSPDGYKYIASYTNLVELLEEWEDYTSPEPLIKDQKVRKAIRAFAELHDSKTITFDETHGGASFISRADNGYSMLWVLGKSWGVDNIEFGKPYTIIELCGEEE